VTVAPPKAIAPLRYASALVPPTAGGLFLILRAHIQPYDSRAGMAKAIVAGLAIACVVYEGHRLGRNRPVSEASKRLVALMLAAAAVLCYFNGFKYTYPPYWHHSDLYHYYMGAKYFPELGYDGLYRCAAVARDQLGTVGGKDETAIAPPGSRDRPSRLPANRPSIALVRRAGFRREGYSPRYLKIAGRWADHDRWALLSERWRPRA
jgi:hypothetical protein